MHACSKVQYATEPLVGTWFSLYKAFIEDGTTDLKKLEIVARLYAHENFNLSVSALSPLSYRYAIAISATDNRTAPITVLVLVVN